jgi:ABC-type dipeptide/oligopeptide/nickel transport system permease component
MTRYLIRRLLQTVPVLFGVSVLAFAIMHVVPGDPVRLIAGPDAPESVVQRVRAELGLERPLYVQYASFLGRAVQGDLGRSLRSRAPVIDEILARFPATLELTTVSMLMAVVVGLPLGLLAAVRRSTWVDYVSMGASLSSLSMPIFWVAIVAIWLFSLQLGWLPVSGRAGPVWHWEGLRHIVLPAATLATTSVAIISRLTRSGMLDVLGREYVTTARQGRLAARGGRQARAEERAHPGGDGGGAAVRLSPRRGRHHRDHLRVAGGGPPRHDGHPAAGLPRRAGLRAPRRRRVRPRQPLRGRALRVARPSHPVRVTRDA